jgi:phospho-N-acetylmuramoyl-pentapeptide-transferase
MPCHSDCSVADDSSLEVADIGCGLVAAVLGILAAGCLAFVVCVLGMSWLIGFLRAHGIGQPIHEALPHHAPKSGTPTMGGIVLSVVTPAGYVVGGLVAGARLSGQGVVLLVALIAGGLVGAVDDFLKVTRGRNTLGLRERQKSVLLLLVTTLVVVTSGSSACHAPSVARCGPMPSIGLWPWVIWVLAIVWLTANSVNFTDGLDGLLAGCSVPPLVLLAAIAYWQHRHPTIYRVDDALQIAIVLAAIAGACLGLLWWNAAPAKVFIGDTGSLAIGVAIVVASIRLNVELLIPVFGAVYAAEGCRASPSAPGSGRRVAGGATTSRSACSGWRRSTTTSRCSAGPRPTSSFGSGSSAPSRLRSPARSSTRTRCAWSDLVHVYGAAPALTRVRDAALGAPPLRHPLANWCDLNRSTQRLVECLRW